MKIVADACGSDRGESVVVEGAVLAVNEAADLEVIITGNEEVIKEELSKYKYDEKRISIIDAKEIITNLDSPTGAIKAKKDSSLVKALELTKNCDDIGGMVSAGSTGAVLTGATLKIGRIKGIPRPALCPLLPTQTDGNVAVVDCGANTDSRPEFLEGFALLGTAYMKANGVENPRVALVSNGDEDKKGNELVHEAFAKLKELPINFVGNMEARYALSGNYDVLVCDGFVGNVLIKSIEGTAKMVTTMLKQIIMDGPFIGKIGAKLMSGTFATLKSKMDYQAAGGAVLLGLKKIVVKGHGSSNAISIKASILRAKDLAEKQLVQNIEKTLAELQEAKAIKEANVQKTEVEG